MAKKIQRHPKSLAVVEGYAAQAACGSREQLFVRIASNLPITELWLWRSTDFQQVMAKVAGLGLWAAPGAAQF